jgi:hypothetical protein
VNVAAKTGVALKNLLLESALPLLLPREINAD